jgi:rRNA maturation protein Nop10
MPTEINNPNSQAKLPEVCCQRCHLYQLYRGKAHTKCIHCGSRLVVNQIPTKFRVQHRDVSDRTES